MNRGNIPGFYYDEEKKKYFKITADHRVPNKNVKYSRGRVELEQRQVKKRKAEQRRHTVRLKQTVKRSRSLDHPVIGGIGLQREQRSQPSSGIVNARDEALVAGWYPSLMPLNNDSWHLSFGHVEPTTQTMIYSQGSWQDGHNHISAVSLNTLYQRKRTEMLPVSTALSGRGQFITTTSANNSPRILVVTGSPAAGFYMTPMPGGQDFSSIPGVTMRANSPSWVPLTGKFQHETGTAVYLTTRMASLIDQDMREATSLSITDCVGDQSDIEGVEFGPSVDWLDTYTATMHCNTMEDDTNPVLLWDTRVHRGGSVSRFSIKDRTTGVLCPASTGQAGNEYSILVSTNHSLRLYDTRMPHMPSRPDRPLLSFRHVHGGPELRFATDGRGLVAAGDRENMIQIYSIRTGRCLGSPRYLHDGTSSSPAMPERMDFDFSKGLQWYEDEREGSCLFCFAGKTMVRWSWKAGECEAEDDS